MKISHIIFLLLGFCITANAQVTCRTDAYGTQRCSGTNSGGERVNTTTRTDNYGTSRTSGTVGGDAVRQTCRTDSYGTTRCH